MFHNTDDLRTDEIYLKLTETLGENKEKGYVLAYCFTICRTCDDTEVGICNLRVGHNRNTYYGGNIGYGIDEPYRGNHYAGKACLLLFELAKRHQMEYLLITCSPENIASRKSCEFAGCILECIVDLPPDNDRYLEGDRQKCIYRFEL